MAKREVAICTLDEETGAEVELGRLRFKDGVLVADPADEPMLEAILDEEITVPDEEGEPQTYRASKDPEAFLGALMRHYRSPYLRACRVARTAEHFDPNQPRDEEGKWSETGAEGIKAAAAEFEGHSEKWYEDLDEDEQTALDDYTEADFLGVNDYMRGGEGKGKGDLTQERHQWIANKIESALGKVSLPKEVTVYRGVSQARGLKIGMEFRDKGFASTSLDPEVAANFARDKKGHILAIKLPKGTKAGYLPGVSGAYTEKELLLQRGARFRVTGVRPRKILGQTFAEFTVELVA